MIITTGIPSFIYNLVFHNIVPPDTVDEEVAARCAAVDVAEAPLNAVDVDDGDDLDRWIGMEVERREARVGTETRHGEAAAVVGVGGSEDLREWNNVVVLAVLIVIIVSNLLGVKNGRMRE